MRTDDLDYDLPHSAIAQTPVEPRDSARLLTYLGGVMAHRHVSDLADLVGPGDVLVVNDTKVLPARLRLIKATGGVVEVLLLERDPSGWWRALVRPSRKIAAGTVLRSPGSDLGVEVGEVLAEGQRRVRLLGPGDVALSPLDEPVALDAHGVMPLPPYITAAMTDPGRYQTVFARQPGSVAAPTAGLHFTEALMERCRARGAQVLAVELVVGLDTFRPVTTDRVEDHVIHTERYRVPQATWDACKAAPSNGGRVIAIGTTSVRALESAAARGELEGRTDLFIYGERRLQVVDVLLTNYHLPRTTLLALLQSFVGPVWRDLYAVALADGYRFLSFGDAMLVERQGTVDT